MKLQSVLCNFIRDTLARNDQIMIGGNKMFLFFYCLSFSLTGQDLLPHYKNSKYGYVNSKNEVVIRHKYDYAGMFLNGFAVVGKRKVNVIGMDQSSSSIGQIKQSSTTYTLRDKGLVYGVIDERGKVIVKIKHKDIEIRDGFVYVFGEGIKKLYDTGPPEHPTEKKDYEIAMPEGFVPSLNLDSLKDLYRHVRFFSIINWSTGKRKIVKIRDEYFLQINHDLKEGLMNMRGEMVIPMRNGYLIYAGLDDLIIATKGTDNDRLYGLINIDNKLLLPFECSFIAKFKENYAVAVKNGKDGLIDSQGKWVLKPRYYDIQGFKNGKVRVKKSKKSKPYYLDRTLNKID